MAPETRARGWLGRIVVPELSDSPRVFGELSLQYNRSFRKMRQSEEGDGQDRDLPSCGAFADEDPRIGGFRKLHCELCGKFEITGEAEAILPGLLQKHPYASVRALLLSLGSNRGF